MIDNKAILKKKPKTIFRFELISIADKLISKMLNFDLKIYVSDTM